MKTYTQLIEDIEQRRAQLRQRQLRQTQRHKERVASYQAARRKSQEKEQLKREIANRIRRELQMEQTPAMTQTPFNVMKAREQAKGGIRHRTHVHNELAREAGAQQAEKRARLKAIMSRE